MALLTWKSYYFWKIEFILLAQSSFSVYSKVNCPVEVGAEGAAVSTKLRKGNKRENR